MSQPPKPLPYPLSMLAHLAAVEAVAAEARQAEPAPADDADDDAADDDTGASA